MLKYVQTIGVSVNNQDRAADFYVNQLGFEKTSDQDMGDGTRWLVVQPPGTETGIMLAMGESAGGKPPGGMTGYVFYTDDLNATYETLKARGVNFTEPPRMEPWGHWAQFADPDGNEYGIWAAPTPAS
jgi:predicted enzyme related to lactoylglutathione lyase